MPSRSTRERAAASPTTHAFQPGRRGYVAFGPHEALLPGPLREVCAAEAEPADCSRHLLRPPGGGEPLQFTWYVAETAWCRYGGKRLGFTAAYLGSHGWTYAGVASEDAAPPLLVPGVEA